MVEQFRKSFQQRVLSGLNLIIKNYSDESNEGRFLEVDVQYSEKLHDLHNDF